MDHLDLRILQTMGFVLWGRQPLGFEALGTGYIADQVDTTPETIRTRIRKMEDRGIIEGYQVYPSLDQFDVDGVGAVYTVPDPDAKARAYDRLALVDGVVDVTDFHGPRMLVTLAHRTPGERDRRLELVARETGDEDPRIAVSWKRQEPGRRFTHLDWRILRALRGQADRSFSAVADDVGASRRTVKRRVDRMTDQGALYVAPLVDPGRIPGLVPFDLFVELDQAAGQGTRNELVKRFDQRVLAIRAPDVLVGETFDLVLYAETIAEVEEMRQQASDVEGVQRALALITRRTMDTAWIDEQIEERVRSTAP